MKIYFSAVSLLYLLFVLFSDSCSENLYFSLTLVPLKYLHLTPPMPTQHKFGSSLFNAISLTSLSTFSYLFSSWDNDHWLDVGLFSYVVYYSYSVCLQWVYFFYVSSCHSFWVTEVQSNAIVSVTHSKMNQVTELIICLVSSSWSSCLILLWGTS